MIICERGAQGFVIVVDLSKKETLESVDSWIDQIFSRTDVKNPTIMVLANKRDLDKRQISNREIEEFQRAHDDLEILCYEVSARNGHNITEAFMELSEKMLNKG